MKVAVELWKVDGREWFPRKVSTAYCCKLAEHAFNVNPRIREHWPDEVLEVDLERIEQGDDEDYRTHRVEGVEFCPYCGAKVELSISARRAFVTKTREVVHVETYTEEVKE